MSSPHAMSADLIFSFGTGIYGLAVLQVFARVLLRSGVWKWDNPFPAGEFLWAGFYVMLGRPFLEFQLLLLSLEFELLSLDIELLLLYLELALLHFNLHFNLLLPVKFP